ncbi:MAG: hypothetical protein O3B24_07940 [Verrucomicrobia bacterium]|nr:hypothetical protein [Verrucomicrobiota bacterium]
MTASTTPALALIGAGYWGKSLARNFRNLGVIHTIGNPEAALAPFSPF